MTNSLVGQIRRYLDYTANDVEAQTVAKRRSSPHLRSGWIAAVLAAAGVVAVVALPGLLQRNDQAVPPGSQSVEPLDLGVDYLWPSSGAEGSPDDVAAEFARVALGWRDAVVTSDTDGSPDGPVWTTIQHPGAKDVAVLSIPVSDSRRALIQVGDGGLTREQSSDEAGVQVVGFPNVEGADSAVLYVRYIGSADVSVIMLAAEAVNLGEVAVPDSSPIASAIVIYRNKDGESLAASGGQFRSE